MDSSTDMDDLTRTQRRPRALPLVGAALLLLVGLALVVGSAGSSPGVAVLGALMVGLSVCSALVQLARGRRPGTAGVSTGSTSDGAPLLTVAAPPTTLLLACAAIAWVALCALAGGVVALRSGSTVTAVVLLVAAAVAAGYLVVPVARGLRSARVELTPQWFAAERFGARWQVPWSDVGGSVPPRAAGQPLAVVVHGTAAPAPSSGWPGWTRFPSAPQGVLAVPVADLPVDPETLARVIALCASDPALRAQLGSPASADWSRWPPGPA